MLPWYYRYLLCYKDVQDFGEYYPITVNALPFWKRLLVTVLDWVEDVADRVRHKFELPF